MKPYSVLFVCMGNICRSPTADGVFRHKVQQHGLQDIVTVDSAGTCCIYQQDSGTPWSIFDRHFSV